MTVPIVDLAEVKVHLKIPVTDTSTDTVLESYIDGILAPIEDHLHEVIVPREITEDLDLCGRPKFWLRDAQPVMSLTSLVSIDGTTTYNPANLLVRSSGAVRVKVGPHPVGALTAVYQAGYETTPENYRQGALVILQYLWEARRNAGQASHDSAAVGSDEYHDVRYAASEFIRRGRVWLGTPRTLAR